MRITILLGIATVVLGAIGMYLDPVFAEELKGDSAFVFWIKLLFASAALLTLEQSSDSPGNALFGAALLFALAFALFATSTIVLTLSSALRERAGRLWIRWSSQVSQSRHAVVIGLGRVGLQLVRDMRAKKRRVVVLERQEDNTNLGEARHLGALVLSGDAREGESRRRAQVLLASEIFISSDSDAANIDIAGKILHDFSSIRYLPILTRYGGSRQKVARCYVHIGEPGGAQAFQTHKLLQRKYDLVDFEIFNVRDNAARQLLLHPGSGLARRYAPSRDEVAHYILFGFGNTGQTLALHMARLAHFENCLRLRLTIVDDFHGNPQLARARDCFLSRHPGFCPGPSFRLDDESYLEQKNRDDWGFRGGRPDAAGKGKPQDLSVVEYAVNAEFVEMRSEVDAGDLVTTLAKRLVRGQRPRVKPAAVLCFEDDQLNFQAALRLRDAFGRLSEANPMETPMPLYTFLPHEEGLSLLLQSESKADEPFPIHTFGQIGASASHEQIVTPLLNKLAAEIFRAYGEVRETASKQGEDLYWPLTMDIPQKFDGVYAKGVDVTDQLPTYEEEYDKASNEDAAAHADIKLAAIGYQHAEWKGREGASTPPELHLNSEQIETFARMEHNRFMGERLVSGWRYGPSPDSRQKLRPSFVPWDELELFERLKDVSQLQALVRGLNAAGRVVEAREDQPGESDGGGSGGMMR